MSRARPRPGGRPTGGARVCLGLALVRADQGARRPRCRPPPQARSPRADRDHLWPRLQARRGLMARRIALIVIALVAVLLGVVAVPLGLLTASQERHDFRDDTVAAAATVSNFAEEFLDDHVTGAALGRSITGLRHRGDLVAVYDPAGRLVAGTRSMPGVAP